MNEIKRVYIIAKGNGTYKEYIENIESTTKHLQEAELEVEIQYGEKSSLVYSVNELQGEEIMSKDKIKWNEFENGFECVNCMGIYKKEELQRVFAYGEVSKENFQCCHCMDCGILWTEVELEGYNE